MLLEGQIRDWQQKILDSYCSRCSDTCCNGNKHRIMLDSPSLSLFNEKGIPIIKLKYLDKSSINTRELHFKNGSLIPKPSIIEMPTKWLFGDEWYLYADVCSFYKDNQCEAHKDERRPSVCRKYPIVFHGCNDPEGKKLDIEIMDSCECFRQEKVRNELTKKFPVRILA